MEAGYQSDEEDTAVPMSYDEKRQVSGVISVTENYADMPKLRGFNDVRNIFNIFVSENKIGYTK